MEVSYFLALLVILFFVFFNYRIIGKNSKGYPPFIFSLLWFFVILIHFLSIKLSWLIIYPLSDTSLLIFVIGVITFSIGGCIGIIVFRRNYKVPQNKSTLNSGKKYVFKSGIDKKILFISVLMLPIFMYQSYQLAQKYILFDSLFAGLRNAGAQGADVGFSKYGIFFGYLSFLVEFYKYLDTKRNIKTLILSVIIIVFYCFISTGRTFFLIFFSLFLGTLIVFNLLKNKYLIYSLFGFVILFGVMGVMLNKGGSTDLNLIENVQGIANNFLIYLIGGLSALDEFIKTNFQYFYGEKTLRLFYILTGSIESSGGDLVQDYVRVPFETNVYTYYRAYIEDFGCFYPFIMLFVFSFLHTVVFLSAKKKQSFLSTFFYSILLYPLIMSFFQDQYLTLLTSWIYLTVIAFIVSRFIVRQKVSKQKV